MGKWQNINEAKLYVTEEKQMGISISPNTNSGAIHELQFEENQTVMFQMQINRNENFPASVPLQFDFKIG